MGIIEPAPSVLGTVPLLAVVEGVCLAQLLFSYFMVASVSSVESAIVGGMEISPQMQCITGAWFLLGVPIIIYGGMGAAYRVEGNLTVHFYYLLGSVIGAFVWLIFFLQYGNTCYTAHPGDESSGPSTGPQARFVCGVSNAMAVLYLAIFVVIVGTAAYLVWSMREYVRRRLETELIRYQEPWQVIRQLSEDVEAEQQAKLDGAQGW